MLGKRNIGTTKASEQAAKLKAERKATPLTLDQQLKQKVIGGFVGCGVLIVAIGGLLVSSYSDNRYLELQNKAIKAKMVEMSQPKYDPVQDFILEQCGKDGVYCKTTQTDNPSLEMLKFLVNFRETPGLQYRLIFELRVGGEKKEREILSCDGEFANFYVCQEITSATPTDVIRAFENSYRSLSGEATYEFSLMVKPIGELDYANPIGIKAK